ncbi:MAG: TetR/AcrR family transcriptional regulator [Rhodococcus sp. (in: high G+C Gram-positive bacteria)]|uniref:TetR/AcrR family transcriptional regulator n=1 Tax=Rhodococcus qingshengii TaxID=334542 RepID=UPI001F146B12|nr:TetR/AcrR family transcriptional regulator [Rhodococcus qingshengii]ULD45103.1 TetR/AcrR family transcriptional regulator [Rhodococcus qingshengii]
MTTDSIQPPPGRRTSMRDEQKRLTRDRLVTASYEVFTSCGYSATTIRHITDAADVNRATFYLHFSGKPEIFLAAADHLLARSAFDHWKTLDTALVTGTRHSIHCWLIDATQWWLDNAEFISAWNEALAVEATLRTTQSAVYDRIGHSLTQYEASLPEGPERQRTVLLIEMLVLQLNSVITQYWQPDTPPSKRAETLDLLTDIWCRTLQITTASAS